MRHHHKIASAAGTALVFYAASAPAQSAQPAAAAAGAPEQVLAGTAPAASPTSPGADGNSLSDIVVTAQKRSERLSSVPMSITAATGDQLLKVGVTDTSQLVKIVPGFTYQLSQYGTPVFGIRGISFFDTSGTAAPAVSVYVDQVPLPLSILSRGGGLDVERVEVLKGPQGTLFGENATGGAINYIAAKPADHLVAGADFTYGRFDQVEAGGYVGDALSDTLSFRLSGRTEQRGDWQYSTSRRDGNGKRRFDVGRLLLDWKPAPALRFELNVNGWRDRSDTQAAQFVTFVPTVPPPQGYAGAIAYLGSYTQRPTTIRAANWDPGFDLKRNDSFFQTSLRADWDVSSAATLTSISSYAHFNGKTPTDVDGTDYPDLEQNLLDHITVLTEELRLSLTTGPLRWLVGGNYGYQKLYETGAAYLQATNTQLGPFVANEQSVINNQKVNTYAGFGGVDWKITPTVTVQGSIRYTRQNRAFQGCAADGGDGAFARAFSFLSTVLSGIPATIAPGACFSLDAVTKRPAGLLHRSLDQHNTSWHAGIDWKPTRDVLLYAGATKGFKAGGFSTLPIGFTSQITSVQQESVLAYEAGIKATLLGGRLQATAAAFHYDYRRKQIAGSVMVPPFGTLPALVNVPRSRINGAEINLTGQPTRALRISLSANFEDSKVNRHFLTYDPFGTLADVYGDRLPNAPRWQTTADAEYDFDTAGRWQPFIGGTVNYQSNSDAIFLGGTQFQLPARTLIDVRAGLQARNGTWSIQFFGRNVTNKYYWINVAHPIDVVEKFAGMPATYGVTLRYRFP